MAQVVYKYKLPDQLNQIMMPNNARILAANLQRNDICIWALVDPQAPKTTRTILVLATGEETSITNLHHIDTIYTQDKALVFHIFEVGGI